MKQCNQIMLPCRLMLFSIQLNGNFRVMSSQNNNCDKCGKEYPNEWCKRCELCQINNFKKEFENWTSGNKKIDELIPER